MSLAEALAADDAAAAAAAQEEELNVPDEINSMTAVEIESRAKMLANEVKILRSEANRLGHEHAALKEKLKDNLEKIKLNRQLPYLVANVVELLDPPGAPAVDQKGKADAVKAAVVPTAEELADAFADSEPDRLVLEGAPSAFNQSHRRTGAGDAQKSADGGSDGAGRVDDLVAAAAAAAASANSEAKAAAAAVVAAARAGAKAQTSRGGASAGGTAATRQDGAATDRDAQLTGKSCVVKTSTRQTVFLPIPGLVDENDLKPGDLVGVNKDSYLILDKLPAEYDSRVKAMEVDEKPTEEYSDVGGLDKQIEELVESVVLPIQHAERFEAIGIQPPKGVLMYGPPGTGKTLLARACAAQSNATFLKLAGPQLVQMYIGDGAKLVRDAFALAKEKGPTIIFIDELDAVGTKRFDSEKSGDREVQRTMLELLNQLDGFSSSDKVKVIAATNRIDILDPALLRSGRLDRKIEFPLPTEDARARIMQIHSRKMTVSPDVNYDELARTTPDFNGAQLRAVCVEAGMLALRNDQEMLTHENYVDGIHEVAARKKKSLAYYA